jgi:hypothetical protein
MEKTLNTFIQQYIHLSLIMSCLHHANLSPLFHPLDLAYEEPELEVQAEQAQAEATNSEPKQGKPRCITP